MSSAFERRGNGVSEARPKITVSDLTMAYGDSVVMQDLNFSVNEGDIFVIMGGSGSGKSTLLRHLVGLQEPARGTIFYEGTGAGFWEMPPPDRERLLRRFGVLYQGGALWSSMTLAENVALPLQEYAATSVEEISALASLKLALVGLSGFEDYYPSEISGGMRKRAGLARAMALDPDILFFDGQSKTMIASGNPKQLLAESKDPRVAAFLTRGEEASHG